MIGTTISHYKILEKLGEGGMGVVYKAQDLKLDRIVAVKFLPHHVTANEAEKARFLQEAKAAAALNHPNICTIHGIEEDGDEQFIVMEYVDGVTLREKFSPAPIPGKETIAYAIQIGEALEEAHAKGIVHRDIKCDNIMVNKKNQVKVMDFGLAKLKGSLKLTKATSTVGTLGYMSPEQIQGRETDTRSDIFSCGIVLFEMLTGRLPFRGEHDAAMMYSIVNEEPESIQRPVPDASSALIHVLNTALEKQPEDRYQTAAEMVRDLRRAQKQTSRVLRAMDATMTTSQHEGHTSERKSQKKLFYITGAAGATVVAILLWLFAFTTSVELNPNMAIRVLDIPLTEIQYPGLSPDGKWLAFPAADANGKWDIYNMNVSGGEPKRVTTDSSDNVPASFSAAISPDGSLIAYNLLNSRINKSEIRVVSSLGGIPKVVSEAGSLVKWRPDGERIGYMRSGGILTLSESGRREFWSVRANGTDQKLEFVDSLGVTRGGGSFAWSPDGESIVWLRTFRNESEEVVVVDLSSREERQLTFDKSRIDEVCWTPNDEILYASNRNGNYNLWMISSKGGEPVQVTKGEGPDVAMNISADNKRLVYLRRSQSDLIWRGAMNGSGGKQLTYQSRSIDQARFSPDRKQIVFSAGLGQFGANRGIYLMDRDGNNRREIVPPSENNFSPLWSPDGKWIAYYSRTSGVPADSSIILLIDALNFGSPKQLTKGRPFVWTKPQTLAILRGPRTWLVNIMTREERPFFEDSTHGWPSAGERFTVFNDLRKARRGIWITALKDHVEKSVDIKLLFSFSEPYGIWLSEDRSFILIWNDIGALWKILLPSGKRVRVPGNFTGLTSASTLSTSYDNKEILYVQRRIDAKLVLIDNVFK